MRRYKPSTCLNLTLRLSDEVTGARQYRVPRCAWIGKRPVSLCGAI